MKSYWELLHNHGFSYLNIWKEYMYLTLSNVDNFLSLWDEFSSSNALLSYNLLSSNFWCQVFLQKKNSVKVVECYERWTNYLISLLFLERDRNRIWTTVHWLISRYPLNISNHVLYSLYTKLAHVHTVFLFNYHLSHLF